MTSITARAHGAPERLLALALLPGSACSCAAAQRSRAARCPPIRRARPAAAPTSRTRSGGSQAPGGAVTQPAEVDAGDAEEASQAARSRCCTATRRARCSPFEAMQKHYYIAGSGLYAANRSPTCGRSRRRSRRRSAWPTSRTWACSLRRELQARLVGLNSYLDTNNSGAAEGTYTSTLAAFDGTVAPPAGPGGTKYYDDNDWVGIELVRALRADPQRGRARQRRGDHGVRDGRLAGTTRSSPARAASRSRTRSKTPNATRSRRRRRPSSARSSTAITQQRRSTCSSRRWPTNGCAPACCSRAACTPTTSARSGVVEPTLWSYNQGTMIGAGTLLYQATGNSRLPLPGAPDRAGGARLLHARTARRGNPVLPVGLLPQPAVPGLGHARSAGAEDRAGLRQLRVAAPAPEQRPVRRPARRLGAAARAGGDRADLRAAVLAAEHLLLSGGAVARGDAGAAVAGLE